MKIVILGGTHGNEFVGVEVIKELAQNRPKDCVHDYKTVHANPKAYQQRRRYVDSDLNRAFGPQSEPKGNEKEQSEKLKSSIIGHYDFLIDLHTTTTDMGLTVILNKTNALSLKAACYLQEIIPEVKIITAEKINQETPYTGNLVDSGITIEVGPVANATNKASLIMATKKMVEALLAWDFSKEYDFSKIEYYQTTEDLFYPKGEKGEWYIHPDLESASFKPLQKGAPVFINIKGEVIPFDRDYLAFPFFIGEAAYQEAGIAMCLSEKKEGLPLLS
jgi:succinylglutamate desuccinylase